MATLELQCPSCSLRLELDGGFAGGVCRCSNCSTLMTVPEDPEAERAEALTRPDAPDIAGKRLDSPRQDSPPATTPTSQADPQTFTTKTGKQVRIGNVRSIPIAKKKRKMLRAAVVMMFIAGVLCVVAVCIAGFIFLMNGPPSQDAGAALVEQLGYDPQANPYLLDRPNVLGLTVAGRTAVIVDASASSAGWLSLLKDAISSGLSSDEGTSASVAIWYVTEDKSEALLDGFTSLSELTTAQLESLQTPIVASGVASLDQQISIVLQQNPDRIILVVSSDQTETQAQQIAAQLSRHEAVVDVAMIANYEQAFKDLAHLQQGQAIELSQSQLKDWYWQMIDSQESEATD